MPKEIDPQIKPWRCKHDHIMGITMRNGSGVRELILYRHAIDPDKPRQVEVMGRLSGYMADIRCSVCGAMRTWVPGEESMKGLVERVKR
jgi:hypothetical protein